MFILKAAYGGCSVYVDTQTTWKLSDYPKKDTLKSYEKPLNMVIMFLGNKCSLGN